MKIYSKQDGIALLGREAQLKKKGLESSMEKLNWQKTNIVQGLCFSHRYFTIDPKQETESISMNFLIL